MRKIFYIPLGLLVCCVPRVEAQSIRDASLSYSKPFISRLHIARILPNMIWKKASHVTRRGIPVYCKWDDGSDHSYSVEKENLITRVQDLGCGLSWVDEEHRFYSSESELTDKVYNKRAPTIIYIHGWQYNGSLDKTQETLLGRYWLKYSQEMDMIKIWREQGYNVAILSWYPFADEKEVKHAEAKIWCTEGEKKMRWRDSQKQYHDELGGSDFHIAQLLLEFYLQALSDYEGEEIRIAGHSLGSQLAVHMTYLLHQQLEDRPKNTHLQRILPKRIALLDPFFSRGKKDYLDEERISERVEKLVSTLINEHQVLFEMYRSSSKMLGLFICDQHEELLKKVAYVEWEPDFLPSRKLDDRHKICVWLYGISLNKRPTLLDASGKTELVAATSGDVVQKWMDSDSYLVQPIYLSHVGKDRPTFGPLPHIRQHEGRIVPETDEAFLTKSFSEE